MSSDQEAKALPPPPPPPPAAVAPRKGLSLFRVLVALLAKLPLATRVVVWHVLGQSEQSKTQDLRTEVIVKILRAFLTPSKPTSITALQKFLGRDPGIKGRIWISKYTSPVPPETSVRDALLSVIEGLKPAEFADASVDIPDIVPVEAEWTAYRPGATKDSTLPAISEKEMYARMMDECAKPTTIMYFHGGGYVVMDPASHRPTTKKLAKLTGGRCYSVRYRLAPQDPFPSAVLDALVSYLTLLYPPPGAFHEPVQPGHIVFAGDSAGGNLSLALLQTVLELRRRAIKITWHGEERDIPVPAGVAVNSPWVDVTHSSPSCETMSGWDYLPRPQQGGSSPYLPCEAWPANPPRHVLYAADAFVSHPLVALLLAPDWSGAPPLYVCTGWELLADEGKFIATKAHADGVTVVHEEYEGMPHCFAMIFTGHPAAKRCFAGWAGFASKVVEHPGTVASSFTAVRARTLLEVPTDPKDVRPYTQQEIGDKIRNWVALEDSKSTGVVSKL